MNHLTFEEAATVANKIVYGSLKQPHRCDIEDIIVERFERLIRSQKELYESADKISDAFRDCVFLIEAALIVQSAMHEYREDLSVNGRTRWVKVMDGIAIQGKTGSALVITGEGELECNLHQRRRKEESSSDKDPFFIHITPFSLVSEPGRKISLGAASRERDRALLTFVFPALEVLGFSTPSLRF